MVWSGSAIDTIEWLILLVLAGGFTWRYFLPAGVDSAVMLSDAISGDLVELMSTASSSWQGLFVPFESAADSFNSTLASLTGLFSLPLLTIQTLLGGGGSGSSGSSSYGNPSGTGTGTGTGESHSQSIWAPMWQMITGLFT